MKMLGLLVTACVWTVSAQTHPLEELIDAARAHSPALKELLAKRSPNLKAQGGVWVWGQDYLFAAEADGVPSVSIDGQPALTLPKMTNSNVASRLVKMRTGVTHSYQFYVDGKPLGEALEDCAELKGVDPQKLAESIGPWFKDWAADGIFCAIS